MCKLEDRKLTPDEFQQALLGPHTCRTPEPQTFFHCLREKGHPGKHARFPKIGSNMVPTTRFWD